MSGTDILIGTKLPLYGEALVSTFRAMRPDLLVEAVSDLDVDAEVVRLRPWLVICSAATPTIVDLCPAWILLFPGDRDEAIVTVAGVSRTLPHAGISELMAVLGDACPPQTIHPIG